MAAPCDHYSEQLEPELIIRPLHKVANGAGGEIGHGHCLRCGASLDLGGNDRVERRQHCGSDTRAVEIGNEITEHGPTLRHERDGIAPCLFNRQPSINIGSQITGQRGGIHNSVTRTVLKPTHMVGGYAQLQLLRHRRIEP
jgi:hypothetical protein